ncbi:MAG: tetratricopeptide repeat protein, partial [Anaerolineae bacterium]
MAGISLRTYCQEARELIKAEAYEKAISICRHILHYYPKYLEIYRLLGEICLHTKQYREASDFFKRVLSADPEDFISRFKLGLIYEDQEALEEAIWQMERAFELKPGNAEVRQGLQRLYESRDGSQKPRLKLTRGALGRLYLKGGLYPQAIAEFKALLDQDPALIDIQVSLSEALWLNEQRLEVTELCQNILGVLPNCLKANLILGEIWLRGERKEEAEPHLRLSEALDPENIIANEMMGHRSPLPLRKVEIPRLEEVPEMAEEARELAALAPEAGLPPAEVKVEEVEEEEIPPWLREAVEKVPAQAPEPFPTAEVEAPAEVTEEEIPDWLRTLKPAEAEAAIIEEAPAEELEIEEAPTWIRKLREEGVELEAAEEAPPEVEAAEVEEAMPEAAEEVPDWLRRLQEMEIEELPMAEEAAPAPTVEEEAPAEVVEEEIPEWLRTLKPVEIEAAIIEEVPAEELEIEEAPTWIRKLRE